MNDTLFLLIGGASGKKSGQKSENTDTGCLEYWQKYFGVGGSAVCGILLAFELFCSRSVLAVAVEVCVSWAPTGCVRTPPTSSLRWSWSTPSTKPSVVTPRPTGSADQCTSTVRCAALPRLVAALVVLARVICSTKQLVARVVPTGREGIPSVCVANVDFLFFSPTKLKNKVFLSTDAVLNFMGCDCVCVECLLYLFDPYEWHMINVISHVQS